MLLEENTIREVPVAELLETWAQLLRELRRRKVLRTNNAPAGDYAEYLVEKALGGTLAANSEKSFDLLTPAKERVQVKARVVFNTENPGQRQLSVIRSRGFDKLVVVLFTPEYRVLKAVQLPVEGVIRNARWQKHVNGWVFHAKEPLLLMEGSKDLTASLQAVEKGVPADLLPEPGPRGIANS